MKLLSFCTFVHLQHTVQDIVAKKEQPTSERSRKKIDTNKFFVVDGRRAIGRENNTAAARYRCMQPILIDYVAAASIQAVCLQAVATAAPARTQIVRNELDSSKSSL